MTSLRSKYPIAQLGPDEEAEVSCAPTERKRVANRLHGIAQYVRQRYDASFRIRTWGTTAGVGVERVS